MSRLFAVVIVVAIMVVAAGLSVYFAEDHPQTSSFSTSTSTSSFSTAASASSTTQSVSSSSSSSSISTPSIAITSTSQRSITNSSPSSNSSSPPQWPMFQYDPQHTGQSPYPLLQNPVILWRDNFSVGNFPTAPPVIGGDGTIYITSDNRTGVLAIWPNGTVRWRMDFYGRAGQNLMLSNKGTLYATDGGALLAFSPTGKIIWNNSGSLNLGSNEIVTAVNLGSNGIIFGEDTEVQANKTITAGVDAFSPLGGTLVWRYPLVVKGSGGFNGTTAAVSKDGSIYFSFDFETYALNSSGNLQWISPRGCEDIAVGGNGTIFCPGMSINPTTGNATGMGFGAFGGIAVSENGSVYATDGQFDPEACGGWTLVDELPNQPSFNVVYRGPCRVPSSPIVTRDGIIYVEILEDSSLFAFTPNGTLVWSIPTNIQNFVPVQVYFYPISPAVAASGVVYVANDGILYAIGSNSS